MDVHSVADFGTVLRERRKELGYTQTQLAEAVGVGTKYLSELENGKPTIRMGLALDIALMLGLDISVRPR